MILKKVAAVAVLVFCFAALTVAQGMAPPQAKPMPSKHAGMMAAQAVYACPKCKMASMKGGKCPGCGHAMEKINAAVVYACDKCHTMAAKAGKCPKCGMAMEKTAHTYACEKCHTTAMKASKCPKCGKAMKEQFVKMMPTK